MAETGQLAAWVGREQGFDIRAYPVPELDFAKRGRTLPINTGHEHTRGAIAPN